MRAFGMVLVVIGALALGALALGSRGVVHSPLAAGITLVCGLLLLVTAGRRTEAQG